jgi:hypothetical protein
MKFKYIGPHDAVDLVGVGTVKRGESVEATGAVAVSLGAQGDWQRVAPPKPRKPRAKKAAPKPEQPTPAAEEKE